jgi:hypothetical protein
MISEVTSTIIVAISTFTVSQWIVALYAVCAFAFTVLMIWEALSDSAGPLLWGWFVGWMVGAFALKFFLMLGKLSRGTEEQLVNIYHATFALCFPACIAGLMIWALCRLLNTGIDYLVRRVRVQS